MVSFVICELPRCTQTLLLPQPERAELWASPPPPWALWWSERWGLHSPQRGWRFSWLCLHTGAWTGSPRSYQPLGSLWLSWLSCCCRQDYPEDTKNKLKGANKSFHSVCVHADVAATSNYFCWGCQISAFQEQWHIIITMDWLWDNKPQGADM